MKQQRLNAAERPEELLSSNAERDTEETDLLQGYVLALAVNVRVSGMFVQARLSMYAPLPLLGDLQNRYDSTDHMKIGQIQSTQITFPATAEEKVVVSQEILGSASGVSGGTALGQIVLRS